MWVFDLRTLKNLLILARFDRPIGIFLLLWPTLTALFVASEQMPSMKLLLIFTFGTILMRAAGCVMNDIFDVNIDKHVQRTKQRLLVTAEVSRSDAIKFLICLLFLCALLVVQLNLYAIALSIAALIFSMLYPLTKRFFKLPQLILGITFGFGILMSFAAIKNEITLDAWLLFIANVFWALSYDSHYAVADLKDDQALPIYSSAKTFQSYAAHFILLSYFAMYLALYSLAKINDVSLACYFLLTCSLIIAMHGVRNSWNLDPKDNFVAFRNNNYVGLLFFLAFLAENFV